MLSARWTRNFAFNRLALLAYTYLTRFIRTISFRSVTTSISEFRPARISINESCPSVSTRNEPRRTGFIQSRNEYVGWNDGTVISYCSVGFDYNRLSDTTPEHTSMLRNKKLLRVLLNILLFVMSNSFPILSNFFLSENGRKERVDISSEKIQKRVEECLLLLSVYSSCLYCHLMRCWRLVVRV